MTHKGRLTFDYLGKGNRVVAMRRQRKIHSEQIQLDLAKEGKPHQTPNAELIEDRGCDTH